MLHPFFMCIVLVMVTGTARGQNGVFVHVGRTLEARHLFHFDAGQNRIAVTDFYFSKDIALS